MRSNSTVAWLLFPVSFKSNPPVASVQKVTALQTVHCTLHEEKGSRAKKGRADMSSLVVLGQLSCPPHTPDLPELYPSLCSPPFHFLPIKTDWTGFDEVVTKFHSNELSPEARCRIRMNCSLLNWTFIFLYFIPLFSLWFSSHPSLCKTSFHVSFKTKLRVCGNVTQACCNLSILQE